MTLEEITSAVDAGKTVCWASPLYVVEKWKTGYQIVCQSNRSAIGLTWQDGTTMNEKEEKFFIPEKVGSDV